MIDNSSTYRHQLHFCNINGIRHKNKKENIHAMLPQFPNTSLITFVESKLSDSSTPPNLPLFIPHHFPFRDRSSGIITYARSHLQYRNHKRYLFDAKDGSMIRFAQICLSGLTFNIGTVYIHPNSKYFTKALAVIEKAVALSSPLLLLGDFNCRHAQLGDINVIDSSSNANELVAFLNTHSLSVLNTINHNGIPTRHDSVLDLAITTHPHLFSLAIDIFKLDSDHRSLSIEVHYPDSSQQQQQQQPPPSIDIFKWNTCNADWEKYHNTAQKYFSAFPDINHRLQQQQQLNNPLSPQLLIDQAASNLTSGIIHCASSCMPKQPPHKQFTYQPFPHHDIYHELHRLAGHIRQLKRKIRIDKQCNNTSHHAHIRCNTLSILQHKYDTTRREWDKAAREHCDKRWHELVGTIAGANNQQVRWKAWRRTIPSGQRSLSSITLHENDPTPTSLRDSLNNFASFYSRVMSTDAIPSWNDNPKPKPKPKPKLSQPRSQPPDSSSASSSSQSSSSTNSNNYHYNSNIFKFIIEDTLQLDIPSFHSPLNELFTIDEIRDAAKYLRKTTAPGPDTISPLFLSKAPPSLLSTITNIFNFSWQHSVVPNEWKKANAFAIFKKGDRSDPSAYRLISITSIIMRLFERLVNNRLVSYLESNHFFSVNQAGFRRQLSTLDNIYRLLRDVYSILRKGKQLPVVFLDIVKAFDRVPHHLLLYKLYAHAEIRGRPWAWLKAFLSNRLFRVTQNEHISDWFSATAGVPQGCVLSPLLFAIFINDLDIDIIELILSLFADDGSGWPQLQSRQSYLSQYRILRQFLSQVEEWSSKWGLEFSVTKTQILLFCNKHFPHHPNDNNPISLNSHNLEFVDQYKYLGLIFQSNGKWHHQFNAIITKAKLTANLISRINHRNYPPGPLISSSLVKYILIPQMTYAIHLWRPTKSNYRTMNQIIASVLRRAAGLHKSASASRTMWEFGIPDIETYRSVIMLQSISRAYRSQRNGNFLPSILVNDINTHNNSNSNNNNNNNNNILSHTASFTSSSIKRC